MMSQKNTMKVLFTFTLLATLSSCSNTKSKAVTSENTFSSTTTKVLASCNKVSNANMSLNSMAVTNQLGQPDLNWIKIKFSFLSSSSTASGNIIRFYKWKMVNGQVYIDQTPLTLYPYNINSGTATSSSVYQITAANVTTSVGYFLNLNDTQGNYQAIKAVVYNSSGSVVAQSDSLIPQFMAKTSDYKYNSDGSLRSSTLTSLHPLATTSTTGWSDSSFQSYFQNFCF